MASIHLSKDEYEKALELYKNCLDIANKLNDDMIVAATLHQLGNLHFKKGEYDSAKDRYIQSLEIKEGLKTGADNLDNLSKAITLAQMGRTVALIGARQKRIIPNMSQKNLFDALRNTWKASILFQNHNKPYYTMTQKNIRIYRRANREGGIRKRNQESKCVTL